MNFPVLCCKTSSNKTNSGIFKLNLLNHRLIRLLLLLHMDLKDANNGQLQKYLKI